MKSRFNQLRGWPLLLLFALPALRAQQEPIIAVDITRIRVETGSGSLVAADIVTSGSGYTAEPAVTITGGGGSGATARVTVAGGIVTGLAITNGGNGYTSLPTITIAPPGATATATIPAPTTAPGPLVGPITITNGGSAYTTAPTVVISGGGGTGAAATATISNGAVTAVTLTSGGAGYTSAPTITLSAPGATATAVARALGSGFAGSTLNESFGPVRTRMFVTAVPIGINPSGGYTLEYFVNGTSLGVITPNPRESEEATLGWTPPQPGAYVLTVKATAGAHVATSSPVRYFATGTALVAPTDTGLLPIGSSVVLQATATPAPNAPNAFVSKMEFYVDGALVGTDGTYPYSMIYTPLATPARHTIEARGYDNNNNLISPVGFATRTLTMVTPIGTPPTVRILNPNDGATVASGSPVALISDAVSPSGFIRNVDFYVNGVFLSNDQSFPFTASWTPSVPGRYQFVTIAFDDKSNAVASAPVAINVTGGFPTIAIATPATGITVIQGTTVPITVQARGADGGIASLRNIQLLVDGQVNDSLPKNPMNVDPPPPLTEPFIFNWQSNVAIGAHRLSARVTDTNSISITSSDIVVNVVPNQPPTVSISEPAAGASFAPNTPVRIRAAAADPDGTVANVEFFVNGAALGAPVRTPPFEVTWTPTTAGPYTLTAKVIDNAGAIVNSTTVSVTVDAPAQAVEGPSTSNVVYRGDYGSPTESGRFALGISRNGRGTFVAFSTNPAGRNYLWSDIAIGTDGTFVVRDGSNNVVLRGQTSATGVSGTFGDRTFIGPLTIGSATFTPLILSGSATDNPNTSFLAIVGGDGSITVYSASGNNREVGADFISAGGSFTINTPTGGRFTGTVTPSAGLVAGSVAGSVTGSFLLRQQPGRLANISTRSLAGTGDRTLLAGFVIRGAGAKPLLIRAVGPTLANFGVLNPLADPSLTILSGSGAAVPNGANDDWAGSAALATAAAQVGAFALNPNSRDAALQISLAPGMYTAVVGGAATPGNTLVEIYDAETGNAGAARIANISTRGQLTAGDALIAGFVITGDQRKRLLIRAVGPTLGAFGITGALADPRIEVFAGTTSIASNNDWTDSTAVGPVTETSPAVGAFPLAASSKDAALVVQLNPGAYSARVTGVGNTTGIVLVEIYDADP